MRRLRISGFTATVMMLTALIVAPLLLTTDHDETYTCPAGSLIEVVHPEPEGGDCRREVAFDSGYACNRTAKEQVAIAGGLVLGRRGAHSRAAAAKTQRSRIAAPMPGQGGR